MGEFPNKGTQFKPGNPGGGRPKGSKNRGTILKKWLETPARYRNPETGEIEAGTIEDKVALAMIKAVINDKNDKAFEKLMDNVYGKLVTQVHVTGNLFEDVMKQYGDTEDEPDEQ